MKTARSTGIDTEGLNVECGVQKAKIVSSADFENLQAWWIVACDGGTSGVWLIFGVGRCGRAEAAWGEWF
jgi:hypothetical protein